MKKTSRIFCCIALTFAATLNSFAQSNREKEPPLKPDELKERFIVPLPAYHIKYTEWRNGEVYSLSEEAFENGNRTFIADLKSEGWKSTDHESVETKTLYGLDPDRGIWFINEDYDGTWEPKENEAGPFPEICRKFYEDSYYDGFSYGFDKYYTGTEKLLGVDCYVYEIKNNGFGVYKKFWLDPTNGAALKYIEREGDKSYSFELTMYSLKAPAWNNSLRPTPYSSAVRP